MILNWYKKIFKRYKNLFFVSHCFNAGRWLPMRNNQYLKTWNKTIIKLNLNLKKLLNHLSMLFTLKNNLEQSASSSWGKKMQSKVFQENQNYFLSSSINRSAELSWNFSVTWHSRTLNCKIRPPILSIKIKVLMW